MEIDPHKIILMHDAFNAELDRQDQAAADQTLSMRERDPKTEWVEGYYDIGAALTASIKAISQRGPIPVWNLIGSIPPDSRHFLATDGADIAVVHVWDGRVYREPVGYWDEATHWMPFPPLPVQHTT